MANTFLGVLRQKNFLKLWIGQVFSQLAYNMVNFLIVLHIYQLTHSSTSISLVLIASALPSVFFGPFSGVLADRLNNKKILVYASLLRFLAVIFLIFSKNNVLGLLEVVFIISTISQFFQPAESSSVPLIVKEEKLVAANSLVITTTYITMLIGYSIAGPLMGLLTPQGSLLLAAAFYLVASYSIVVMRQYDFKEIKKISLGNMAHVIEQIWFQTKSGVTHLTQNRKVYLPMIKLSMGWVVLGAFVVLIPGFAEKEISLSTNMVGPLLIAPAGIGMLLGAYYLDKKKSFRFSLMSNYGFVLTGACLLLFSLFRYYKEWAMALPVAIALMILMGAFCSVVYISSQTVLQTSSDKAIRGRIFGISSMFTNLAMSIPAILVGGLSDLSSPFAILLTLAIAAIAYGFYAQYREQHLSLFVGERNV